MKTVFVSSTFKDMQVERDLLNTRVLPQLNELAQQYGDNVAFCDLRWGINTGGMDIEESNKKILGACLHEIDHCRPYMIVFLGARYGWIPGDALIWQAIEEYPQIVLEDHEISITALEIEYGALMDPEQFTRTLFYFREFDGPVPEEYREEEQRAREKLTALKERISTRPGANVQTYTVRWDDQTKVIRLPDEFEKQVLDALFACFRPEWEKFEQMSAFERENAIHWENAVKNAENFYEKSTCIDLCRSLLEKRFPFFAAKGSAGMGKTAMLSKLACERLQVGAAVLPVFCGLTKTSATLTGVLAHITEYLRQLSGTEAAALEERADIAYWEGALLQAVSACAALETDIDIMVDAGDLLDRNIVEKLRFWFREMPANMSLVVSCARDIKLPCYCPDTLVSIGADYFDTKHILETKLKQAGKELDDMVVLAIMKKKEADNPLYLQMLLRRLTIMQRTDFEQIAQRGGDAKAIAEYQCQLIRECGGTLPQLCLQLIQTAGEKINPEMSAGVLRYILASYQGLREETLRRLAAQKGVVWSALDFRILIQFLEGLLVLRGNGRYDITHLSMRENFKPEPEACIELLDYLRHQDPFTAEDAADYAYACLSANQPAEYLWLLQTQPALWKTVAQTSAFAVGNYLVCERSSSDQKRFLERWAQGLSDHAREEAAQTILDDFFTGEYQAACGSNVSLWRVMARVFYRSWEEVDQISDSVVTPRPQVEVFREEDHRQFQHMVKSWRDRKKASRTLRREHLVDPAFRCAERMIEGHLFYFFNVPREHDSDLFFMRDDCILLKFGRSGVGDHCTYNFTYDAESQCIVVQEADFDHYSVDTTVSTYTIGDPFSDKPAITMGSFVRKGAYNLPLFFPIA